MTMTCAPVLSPLPMQRLPALSIRQPWATSIVYGGKDVENRDWPTRFRGRFLIHASKGMTLDEIESWKDFMRVRGLQLESKWIAEAGFKTFRDLPRGGIIGEAELVDCVTQSDSRWFMGRYGFVIRYAKPLPFTPCRGALGFFIPEFPVAV